MSAGNKPHKPELLEPGLWVRRFDRTGLPEWKLGPFRQVDRIEQRPGHKLGDYRVWFTNGDEFTTNCIKVEGHFDVCSFRPGHWT